MNRSLFIFWGIFFLGLAACAGDRPDANSAGEASSSADSAAIVRTTAPDTTADTSTDTTPADSLTLLEKRRWVINTITFEGAKFELSKDVEAFLTFANGRVEGSTGCNNFNGTYQAGADNSLQIGTLATTKKMCPSLMVQERRIQELLQNATRFVPLSRRFLEIESTKGKITALTDDLMDLDNQQ